MKTLSKNSLIGLVALMLGLLLSSPSPALADESHSPHLRNSSVEGNFDWSIVPANFNMPGVVLPGTDGRLYVRHLPLIGKFRLAGHGVSIVAKIHADLDGELDSNYTGVLWAPVTLTAVDSASRAIVIFQGRAIADTVALVSTGVMELRGRGKFEGATLTLTFQEIGPGNSDTYRFKGQLKYDDGARDRDRD
jgi:hypothetical protein